MSSCIKGILAVLTLLAIGIGYFVYVVTISPPVPKDLSPLQLTRNEIEKNFYVIGNNWLKKSKTGLWELYVEGSPFERGVITGKLTKELIEKQEVCFVDEIQKLIPSKWYMNFLKYMVAWFNRDMDKFIDEEYKMEIYGVSMSASAKFNNIGTNYQRLLNYHATHDIGHALQDRNYMPGCTSFSAWDTLTDDHTLIVGRNFDFAVGEAFAEDKIVCFYKPDNGNKFMMVTWGGMIGCVSGMNDKGLTVTINAGKSDVPLKSATPISLVAREILQYAGNIQEAYKIAAKRQTFVSEAIMIGSVADNKTAIIEKSPSKTGIKFSSVDYLICSNHFQSDSFAKDPLNIENIRDSDSPYRYKRMKELINKHQKIRVADAAAILRNRMGLNDSEIGMGNPKAINQLIAHHSVIFKPEKHLVWVSTNPWQLGEYVCYDLEMVFNKLPGLQKDTEITSTSLHIPADTFLYSETFRKYERFKVIKNRITEALNGGEMINLTDENIDEFIESNPHYYLVYSLLGDYFIKMKDPNKAVKYYKMALNKEIPRKEEVELIDKKMAGATHEAI